MLILALALFACVITGTHAIVKGDAVTIDHSPWTVNYGDICGGVIINPQWVISSIHCGKHAFVQIKVTYLDVRHGEYIRVTQYHEHPKYKKETKEYDIQMLRLRSKIKFGVKAQPATLGEKKIIKKGQFVSVWGYGEFTEGLNTSHGLLHKATYNIIDNSECKKTYPKLTSENFCAGLLKGGKGPCAKDSGGPATVAVGDEIYVVGIFSYTKTCAKPNIPDVYVDILSPAIRDWIDKTSKKPSSIDDDCNYGEKCQCRN